MAPSKPSNVKVSELQTVLNTLLGIQSDIKSPPPESFEVIEATPLESNLTKGGNGLQGEGAHKASQRYHDNAHYFNRGWGDVSAGVDALVAMLTTTISEHTKTDTSVAQGANNVNTSTGGSGAGNSQYSRT